MNISKFFLCLFTSVLSYTSIAQLPGTNIYSLNFLANGDKYTIQDPLLLTSFNSSGYNNQPSFVGDEIFITSNWRQEGQTDIVAMDYRNRSLYKVTATAESEYSPTIMPDKQHFSVVRVEQDGNDSQVLWQYPIDRSSNGKKVLDNISTVGYYAWLNSYMVAMFLVDDPHKLVVRNIFADENKIIASDIGRSLHARGGNLFFVEKVSRKFWYVSHYNTKTEEITKLIQTLPQREDFIILPDGTLLMGDRSILFKFNAKTDKEWVLIDDLSQYGIKNITRMSYQDNQLLIVDSQPE